MTVMGGEGTSEAEKHLLIVDDDEDLRALLERYLGEHGYRVSGVGEGVAMKAFLADHHVDLIILDLMLPGDDGLVLAQYLRQNGDQPVLMLSARGEEVDRIIGLEMGADDYLPKPFNARELLARIKALLRRIPTTPQLASPPEPEPETEPSPAAATETDYSFDRFILDLNTHTLKDDQQDVPISGAEFSLLRVFLENTGQILSRDDLVQKLKGYERLPYDRSIDVRVTRLRKKIEPDPSHPVFIRTVWGKGYLFTPNSEDVGVAG